MSKVLPPASVKKKSVPAATVAGPRKNATREIVESIVIAFVLAFLFRAFEAEAFVIPTGSMAPTLMGVHKDLECAQCGFPYRVSASEEQDEVAEQLRVDMTDPRLSEQDRQTASARLANSDVISCICPNCRFKMDIDPQTAAGRMYPTFKGDRILVAKFPYEFADPQRWDVVVFKYPQTANENYIKRCVGIPNETVVIHSGDIYTSDNEGQARTIARKPPDKVRAIMQAVYDNQYVLDKLTPAGLPLRWQPINADGGNAWTTLDGDRAYRVEGTEGTESWLGYQHRIPSRGDWQRYLSTGKFSEGSEIPARLIDDFYAYNTGASRIGAGYEGIGGLHWVGDLILECEILCEQGAGQKPEAVLRLVKGGRTFDCAININTGEARLVIGGVDCGTAATPVRAGTRHTISYANVDAQLLLWIDGRLIHFDQPTTYEPEWDPIPTQDDLTPARIGARGASIEVRDLRLLRDVYYISCRDLHGAIPSDYESPPFDISRPADVAQFMATPSAWPRVFSQLRTVKFPLGEDEFLMLGDNSPRSKDSRLWTGRDAAGRIEHFVKRDLLVGKAVFVYWPHSWNRIPGTRIPFPFFPNFARMKFVR